ncbi:MAG: hypothetical protein AAB016_03740 [candidate division NC10 bacterium]
MFEPRGFGDDRLSVGASQEARPESMFEPRGFGDDRLSVGARPE